MRILFCINSLGCPGGIERVTIVKANALARIPGNEVAICYTDKGNFPKTIHPLSPAVKTFDLNTPYWGFTSAIKIFFNFIPTVLKTRKSLINVINIFKPDVVVSTGSYEKFALAGIRGKDRTSNRIDGDKILKIREFHFGSTYRRLLSDSRLSYLKALFAESFERQILSRFFDKSFLLTKTDLDLNFHNNVRFDYMHNPSSFSPSNIPDYRGRKKIVLAVGRICAQKNFESLLNIWSLVSPIVPDWKLRIVGNGSDYSKLVKQAAKLGINASVELPGYSSDVENEMGQASIYVMTSRFEGFPLVLVEAQSMGLPIVTFDTPYGPSEIVRDGLDGFIVGYNDINNFKDTLLKLISNSELRYKMSNNALQHSRSYSADIFAKKWMEKYNALLAEK